MRLSLPIPTSLLFLLLPFQSFSSPAPEPLPKTQATQNGPITVPVLSLGGAVQSFGGNTRVCYQHTDTSIHELVGSGSPNPNHVYIDQVILPVGKARTGTPIVVLDYTNNLGIHIFYISPDDKLREFYFDRQWLDGTLNAANITTRTGSRYLWGILLPGPPGPSSNRAPRVGFAAPNGDLSEVALEGGQWNKYIY